MGERVRLRPEDRLPILGVKAGEVPRRVVVVGDPKRARAAAAMLEGAEQLGETREYVTFRGVHQGVEVGVVSHGVGASGAGVCFEELCRAGAERVLRAGTCGGMQPEVVDGHLVVATAAVRAEGFTDGLVPPAYPAVAHPVPLAALQRAAGTGGDVHTGVVLTSGVFYPHPVLGSDLALWQRAGVVAVEMEVAALYVVAALHGVEAAAILAVDGNPLAERDEEMTGYDPDREVVHRAVERMLRIALDAVVDDAQPPSTAM